MYKTELLYKRNDRFKLTRKDMVKFAEVKREIVHDAGRAWRLLMDRGGIDQKLMNNCLNVLVEKESKYFDFQEFSIGKY